MEIYILIFLGGICIGALIGMGILYKDYKELQRSGEEVRKSYNSHLNALYKNKEYWKSEALKYFEEYKKANS